MNFKNKWFLFSSLILNCIQFTIILKLYVPEFFSFLFSLNWLCILQLFSTILIPIIGYYIFWPQYKKQKRIDNQMNDAKQTLFLIVEFEAISNELKRIHENQSSDSEIEFKKAQEKLQKNISLIRAHLLLLAKDIDLKDRSGSYQWNKNFIHIEQILNNKAYPFYSFSSIDVLQVIGLLDDQENSTQFKNDMGQLKKSLIIIYHMNEYE